jgi:cell division protease FtsH
MAVLLGGRAAEMLIFGKLSTGASDDLSKATDIARSIVARYGMDEKLGEMTYETEPSPFLQAPGMAGAERRRYSEQTAREIDCAIRVYVHQAFEKATKVLERNRKALEKGARDLLASETLSADQLPAVRPVAAAAASAAG